MSGKILVVDDEKGIVAMLKSYFEMRQFQVYTAFNGKEALEKISCQPDIILLDINMPEIDGLTVCQRIREHILCPILFLTARIETSDKIKGFDAGADDYILKPFDIDELGARVEAHLRRENRKQGQTVLRFFGDMAIDYQKREITVGQAPVTLSKKEFDIVELLSVNAGQVFDRERIYDIVWGLEGDGSSDTIMEHIRKIRVKFAAASTHNYIDTVWGVGYKLNAAFSHDLRNPVTVLKGSAAMLQKGLEGGSLTVEAAGEAISLIKQYAGRIENYIEAMTNAQKLEDLKFSPQPADWLTLAKELENSLTILSANAGIEVNFFRSGEDKQITANKYIIHNTAENLTDNALRYAKEKVSITLSCDDEKIIIAVSDDGPGFSDDILNKGAVPFLHDANSEQGAHFGMGLYICRLLCEKHGGGLTLENCTDGAKATAVFYFRRLC